MFKSNGAPRTIPNAVAVYERDGWILWRHGGSIENEDLVLWYTVGITHIPRVEEWPVMNTHRTGFMLMPGFFSKNPALDVPETKPKASPSSGG